MTDLHDRMRAAGGGLPPASFTIDDLTSAGGRRVRRRRWAIGATSAAAVVASVALFVGLQPVPSPTTPVVQPAEPSFAVTFKSFQVAGFRVADPAVVTPGYVSAGVWRDGDHVGLLTAYRRGVYRPEAAKNPSSVDIDGKRGIRYSNDQVLGVRTGTDPAGVDRGGPVRFDEVKVDALAWEVAPDTWATLESFGPEGALPDKAMRELAGRFRPSGSATARIPYMVGYLPPGYELVQAGTYGRLVDANDGVLSGSAYHRGVPAFAGLTGILEFESPSSTALLISVRKTDPPVRDNCRPATTDRGVICERALVEGLNLTVDDRTRLLKPAEVEKIINGITPADLNKPATWPPAA